MIRLLYFLRFSVIISMTAPRILERSDTMNIYFGENLRTLRRGKNLTQENLADVFGVSFQTVSKWERGDTYPDITMLPEIADFFKITTDELLGVNRAEKEKEITEKLQEYDNHTDGKLMTEIIKDLKGKYPNDFRILIRYLACLVRFSDDKASVSSEILSIYENIQENCTNDKIRIKAKRSLIEYYRSEAEKDEKYFTYAVKMEEKQVTPAGETCFQPTVSPDGEWIAYLKDRTAVAIMNIKSGKEKILLSKDINYSYTDGDQSYEWSPDSKYILCNYQADGGWNNDNVALIDIETGEITDLTQSGYSDGGFKWALKGKAMTWSSDKDGYRSHGSWGAERDVYLMVFDRKAYLEFLKDKEDRELTELLKSEKEEKKEKKDSVKAEKKVEKTVLDLEDRHNRIIKLTPFAGRLGDHYLTQDGKKFFYMMRLERSTDLCMMNLEDRSIKVVAKGVYGSLYPTADDKDMYLLSGGGIKKISVASGQQSNISFNGEFDYRPADEREYIFNHIWKQVDEKFYVADIHGIDWKGFRDIYAKFLPHIDNNFDFQEMLSEMLGELNGSHTGARYYYRPSFSMATLGVLYDLNHKGDGLKIQEVLKGGMIYTQDPEVKAGDIIEAINGIPVKEGMDWYHLLQQKAGKKTVLTIRKGGKKAVDIYVEPSGSDSRALYNRWVEQRAEMVKKLSNGRIGYVHVEGMDSQSFRRVYSELLGKYRTCEAVIVDTRHNGGGWLHDDLATLLDGQGYIRFEPRGQYIGTEPYNKWTKPSCVLIGEDNYSDACGFPYVYKTLGIGKLIGAPVPGTMTAVWWENQIDNSLVFGIPQVGAIGVKEGRYLENMQIEPDILVYNDPASVLRGEDKQLETAVAEMLKQIDNK